jgi:hypothetical protein
MRRIEDLVVGNYLLQLQLSAEEIPQIEFEVVSTATDLSPEFSFAQLAPYASYPTLSAEETMKVYFTPRNKHNATLVSLDAVTSQVYCYAINEKNSYIELS